MFFKIDESDGIPIYEQVVRQVKYAVASEVLKTGQMIPSVRELARKLRINPNTVAKAYRQLQQDEVIAPVRTTGLVVAVGGGAALSRRAGRIDPLAHPASSSRSETKPTRLGADPKMGPRRTGDS